MNALYVVREQNRNMVWYAMVNPVLAGMALGGLAGALLMERKIPRSEWEVMFDRWTGPASPTEEARVAATEYAVRRAVETTFGGQVAIKIIPQGSSVNNTNVKTKSDLDLVVLAEQDEFYLPNPTGGLPAGIVPNGHTVPNLYPQFRREVINALLRSDGLLMSVKDGGKALKLSPNTEARVDCDVLPAFRSIKTHPHQHSPFIPRTDKGIIFLDGSMNEVISYPEQHLENGRRRNDSTGHKYKKMVRILKKIKDRQLSGRKSLFVPTLPSSYQIECLVYNVPDHHLLVGGWYDSVMSCATWIHDALNDSILCNGLIQVNGMDPMFNHWDGAGLMSELLKPIDVERCDEFITQVLKDVGP